MNRLLVLKIGAMGDVLRTTSILPGLHRRYPDAHIHWVCAPGAVDLLRGNPRIHRVHAVDPADPESAAALLEELGSIRWDRVMSLDDDELVCRLASSLGGDAADGVISGAHLGADGELRYTRDAGPWFDMGLLSIHGKAEADRLKLVNEKSHAKIYSEMLGIQMGEPELSLPDGSIAFAADFAARTRMHERGPLIGLNTGAGGRWESKKLPVQRTIDVVGELTRRFEGEVSFLLLGGLQESGRNSEILAGLNGRAPVIDSGTENSVLDFAALIDRLDLLISSDSLALHVAIARRIPVIAFFAPTSAAEIELYGRGEKVRSLSSDYCSYRADADTSTLTAERIADAAERLLGRR